MGGEGVFVGRGCPSGRVFTHVVDHAWVRHALQEDDPFVCDVTGALISMIKDGRYHFDDGRKFSVPVPALGVCAQVGSKILWM